MQNLNELRAGALTPTQQSRVAKSMQKINSEDLGLIPGVPDNLKTKRQLDKEFEQAKLSKNAKLHKLQQRQHRKDLAEKLKNAVPLESISLDTTISRCPRCNAPLVSTLSISGAPSTDWLECSNVVCNTFVDTYHPMPHQASVHLDPHRIIGNFGSYGTGKTKTSEKELEKHIFLTPDANILLGANVTSQYEQTLLRDFEKSFPSAFMESRSQQKGFIDFINGARLMLRPFDDPNKLRSNNYSLGIILEASETDAEAFHQIKTRLRNMSATIPMTNSKGQVLYDKETKKPILKADWRKLICESNPDSGWIRSDILLVSDEITQFGRFADEDYSKLIDPLTVDPNISSHIASTDVNYFLPEDYIAVNSKNKPDWWIKRFIYGSFMFAEGLVYPHAVNCIVPTPRDSEGNPLTPRHFPKWRVLMAHDYGLMDEATFVYGAVDTERNKLIIYRNDHTHDAALKDLAALAHAGLRDVNLGQLYTTPIIDPKNNKRDYNKRDLITQYADYGLTFKPGHINVEARVIRLNDYIESGNLEIWDCCTHLIKELKEYKFQTKTLDTAKSAVNKPMDANNHSINALEWIGMELPSNPSNLYLSGFDEFGRKLSDLDDKSRKAQEKVWQLSDDDDIMEPEYDQTSAFGIQGGFY